jgi:apoptosis-inducing factor 3
VFAAGDIASYVEPRQGHRVRIEHWRVAAQQGRVAACNMLGQAQPFDKVPLFWSAQHGKGFYYVGHADEWDEVVVHGDANDGRLLAYYLGGGSLVAVLGAGRNREIVAIEECLRLQRLPPLAQIRADTVDWVAQAVG